MSDDLTPKELDDLPAKMTEEFMKEDHRGIFSGVPNNAASFHPTAANSKPITVEKLLKMRNDMDVYFPMFLSSLLSSGVQKHGMGRS